MLSAKKQTINVIARGMSQHVNRASPMVDKFVRVDHAGELGADRIYAGQMAVLGTEIGSCLFLIFMFSIKFLRSHKSWTNNQAHVGTRESSSSRNGKIDQKTSCATDHHDTVVEYCWICTGSWNGFAWRKGSHGLHGCSRNSHRRTLQQPAETDNGKPKSRQRATRSYNKIPRRRARTSRLWNRSWSTTSAVLRSTYECYQIRL